MILSRHFITGTSTFLYKIVENRQLNNIKINSLILFFCIYRWVKGFIILSKINKLSRYSEYEIKEIQVMILVIKLCLCILKLLKKGNKLNTTNESNNSETLFHSTQNLFIKNSIIDTNNPGYLSFFHMSP